MKKSQYISFTALGIALYVVLSMTVKIPVISHISLDLGYIVLAIYCYHMGALPGMIVGGVGCVLISLLTTCWFPPGWLVGNLIIGLFCGLGYSHAETRYAAISNVAVTILAVGIGICFAKTVIECIMFQIPLAIKLPKNAVAFGMDSAVMLAGLMLAKRPSIAKFFRRLKPEAAL